MDKNTLCLKTVITRSCDHLQTSFISWIHNSIIGIIKPSPCGYLFFQFQDRNFHLFSYVFKIQIFIAIIGFSMKNALKWAQICPALVQGFLIWKNSSKFTFTFPNTNLVASPGRHLDMKAPGIKGTSHNFIFQIPLLSTLADISAYLETPHMH